jgi:PPOX class probable F420-dependent enzyme
VSELTHAQVALLRARSFAVVSTLQENGTPQTSIVWVDTDGEHVVFNTTNARAKGKNLRRDPRLSVTVFDADDPYHYFEVEGVGELSEVGADDYINELSRKYTGNDFHAPFDRVTITVRAQRIFNHYVGD